MESVKVRMLEGGVGLRPCPRGHEGASTCRKDFVTNEVQTNLAFGFFRLVEEVTLNGIGNHSFEVFPTVGLGEDGFRKTFGHKATISLLGDRKDKFHANSLKLGMR